MNITESTQNKVHILSPKGRVDSQGAIDLELSLQEAWEAGNYQVVLNLAEVTYINSAGLRILAAMLTQNQSSGGDLVLASPSAKIQRVLKIVGFDNFFRVFDNLDDAVRAF